MSKVKERNHRIAYSYGISYGCMWEGNSWKIYGDCKCSALGGGKPCEHCHSEHDENHINDLDGSQHTEHVWICPRVVVAKNEGGSNSTGICLDCILKAAALITPRGTVIYRERA